VSKQPYRPLSSIDILADAPPATERPEPPPVPTVAPPKPKEGRRQSGYRYTVETHEALRLAAFQQRRTIQDIIDEAVLLWLSGQPSRK
jgi:hypothetical protein